MSKHKEKNSKHQEPNILPSEIDMYSPIDFSDIDEVRKAVIAAEILNRKY